MWAVDVPCRSKLTTGQACQEPSQQEGWIYRLILVEHIHLVSPFEWLSPCTAFRLWFLLAGEWGDPVQLGLGLGWLVYISSFSCELAMFLQSLAQARACCVRIADEPEWVQKSVPELSRCLKDLRVRGNQWSHFDWSNNQVEVLRFAMDKSLF